MVHTPITPDLPIAEAGRRMMADELITIQTYWPDLRLMAEITAVHETRKAIRRTFTLLKLFTPYFAPGVLDRHRDALRRLMSRLGPCRDIAVFRLKLSTYNETSGRPLPELVAYWDSRQVKVDQKLRKYIQRWAVSKAVDRYSMFVNTEGAGLPHGKKPVAPLLVRHILPALIFQRLATVRAYGDILPSASVEQFHQLRIQFKELRYTLTFFEDLLDGNDAGIIELSRRMQEHLGDLNDASVALRLLDESECCPEETAEYRYFQEEEVMRLTSDFMPLYAEFAEPQIRRCLALTLADL